MASEGDSETPEEITDTANAVVSNLLPAKSKFQYEKVYRQFRDWCKIKNVKKVSESVLLCYLEEKSKTFKPPTLWSTYSMLKTTLNIKENIDLRQFPKLVPYLKSKSVGYRGKKSKVLNREDVKRFIGEADDETHLLMKIAYLIAFAFELLWILQAETALPAAAVLLCAGYFTMALFAALLIHGLATVRGYLRRLLTLVSQQRSHIIEEKTTLCLIAWMFSVTVLTFPEAGMVIYMSIQYWRIENIYGVTELCCWLNRIIVNVIQLILVQSLYTLWKDEEIVVKRLRDLNLAAIPIPRENLPPLNSQFYQNNGYDHSMEQLSTNLKRVGSTPQLWNVGMPNNVLPLPIPFDGYQFCTTQSEFNASVFMPNFVESDMTGKKAQSLMDLRLLDNHTYGGEKLAGHLDPWASDTTITETSSAIIPNYNTTKKRPYGSPRLTKCASVDALNEINKNSRVIKSRSGFYAQPIANYGVPIYYGPLDGPDFLIYKKQMDKLTSKNSLSNTSTEDVQKYRDVAL